MTAKDYLNLAAELAEETALVQGVTAQQQLRGHLFDYNEPLPDLNIARSRSWEPAARRYRDLEPNEKEANA